MNATRIIPWTFRLLGRDLVWNILMYPVWWYTTGMKRAAEGAVSSVATMSSSMGLPILVKSLFKPMYGQRDIWGRVISFGVRIVHLSILLVMQGIWTLVVVVVALLWPLVPIVVVLQFLFQFQILS